MHGNLYLEATEDTMTPDQIEAILNAIPYQRIIDAARLTQPVAA